jgi:hypothetical protein
MRKSMVTFAMLYLGCGGLASPQSEAPSQPSSDDTLCVATDGSIEAVWGGTPLTLTRTCFGESKLAFIGGSSAFQMCAQDAKGLTIVLGEYVAGEGEEAQLYLDDQEMAIPWVANSVPGFDLTVTAIGPPGHYVEGTFTGLVQKQNTSTSVQAGPTASLSGSFKVCRGPDEPLPN